MELEGKVVEALPNARFRIELDGGQIVLGYISGKMRMFKIKILTGDRVLIEMTPYDVTRGRIVRRL